MYAPMLLCFDPSNAMDEPVAEDSVYSFLTGIPILFYCVLLVLTASVLYILHDMNKKPSRSFAPPTIWGLPIVGNLLQLGTSPHLALTKMGKTLGDVFLLRLGSWDVLVINSLDVAKDAFVKNAAHFSSRPPWHSLRLGNAHIYSVSFGDYNPLQVQRKKALLRVFHQAVLTNPDNLNHILSLETARMNKQLLDTGGHLSDPREILKMVVSRLVFRLVFGGPIGEQEEKDLLNVVVEQSRMFQEGASVGILADVLPWLRFALKGPITKMEDTVEILLDFVRKSYRQRKHGYKSGNGEFCVARAVTAYVASERRQLKKNQETSSIPSPLSREEPKEPKETIEQGATVEPALRTKESLEEFALKDGEKEEKKEDDQELMEDEDEELAVENHVVAMLAPDVIGAASENIASTFSWAFAFISSYEELQQDLHNELDAVIGRNREPCIQDKQRMPLMQATILEVLRLSSSIPMGLPHYCIEDSVVKGYSVAKGTVVLTNIWGINHDDRHFSHPYCFEPYRFLDATGALRGDRCSLSMTFNIGPRSCAGNTVTKTVLFVFISSVLQKFEVRSTKDLITTLEAIPGPVRSPDEFQLMFCPR